MIKNIKDNLFLKDLLEMLLILIWSIELNLQEKFLCLIEKEYGMKKESIMNLCHETSKKDKNRSFITFNHNIQSINMYRFFK
jgi:hypothetical protein